MNYIYSAMGWVLKQLYEFLGLIWSPLSNYAFAIIAFTLLVKIIFLPININQQRTTAKQTAVKPKLDALKAKCGDDKQKYQMEMQELYKRENVKLMGGCLPQLITLPFLWGVWMAIRSPLSYILSLDSTLISDAKNIVAEIMSKKADQITELDIIDKIKDVALSDSKFDVIRSGVANMNFNLFGINLTKTPKFSFDFSSLTSEDFLLWIIPIASFLSALLSSYITTQMQKKTNPEAAASAGCMMLMIPFMSLYISFIVPGAVGFYWMCSNIITTVIQVILNKTLSPYKIIARSEIKNVSDRRERESKIMSNN